MALKIKVSNKRKPVLDPNFVPAIFWNRAYREAVKSSGSGEKMTIALERSDGTVSIYTTEIFPHKKEWVDLNIKYVERIVKFLLWMKGGYKITIAGNKEIADFIRKTYSPKGERKFDDDIIGVKNYGKPIEVINCPFEKAPSSREIDIPLGGHFDGCRIGFDLGGSDRKCAAVIDGKVVFTDEVVWDPYVQKDPQYHISGVADSLKRAAAKMPRVDAIGGSAAGAYVNNQVRVASLFRAVPEADFKKHIVNMFLDMKKEWNNVPFVVVNDGEVTALAGAISMNTNTLLGIAMGTSQAAGYVTSKGTITNWLNELAFVPVDYRDNAPIDEWSGDIGCGSQYFSQQAVGRLAPVAGIDFPKGMPLPEKLVGVQKLMAAGDQKAKKIYETIGTYLGYTIAHYADFYDMKNLLVLGRVMTGTGGDLVISIAEDILKEEFPDLASSIKLRTPDEKSKRLGQAVVAASLPIIEKK
ncbi:MAG: ROK family protein [Elusimicrobia bacterium]|nr:ROK family protein [Elusimicrobiota bacterium]